MAKNKGRQKPQPLHTQSSVNAVAIKVYLEQLLKDSGDNYAEDEIKNLTLEEIAETMRKHLKAAIKKFDKREVYVISMVHDKDLVAKEGSPFLPSAEKPHAHILVKRPDRTKRAHVSTILNQLGIKFRNPEDSTLFNKGGCETIGSFNTYTLYLTHDTEKAIREGKTQYTMEEYISNLTIEEIKQIREGNSRMIDASGKVTMQMLEALDKEAFELGYNSECLECTDYTEWYAKQPFPIRSHSKMKYIEESYHYGKKVRREEQRKMTRQLSNNDTEIRSDSK